MATDPPTLIKSQRDEAKQPHQGQKLWLKRLWKSGVITSGLIAVLILVLPIMISRSRMGHWIVAHAVALKGGQFQYERMRIGWVTPIQMSGVVVQCNSPDDRLRFDQIDGDLTLLGLFKRTGESFGRWHVSGLHAQCAFREGRCSLEDDFASLTQPPRAGEPKRSGQIEVHDLYVEMTDEATDETWELSRAKFTYLQRSGVANVSFAASVATLPEESGTVSGQFLGTTSTANPRFRIKLSVGEFPLSLSELIRGRFQGFATVFPDRLAGRASGSVDVWSDRDGELRYVFDRVAVNHLSFADPWDDGRRCFSRRATLDGKLWVMGDDVLCEDVHLASDFMTLTLDATLPRPARFAGLTRAQAWLNRVDGSLTATVDFAQLQKSLPDTVVLRDNSRIVSGQGTFKLGTSRADNPDLESDGSEPTHTCQLLFKTDEVVVDTANGPASIDPMDLTATLVLGNDRFEPQDVNWISSFATVVGKGQMGRGELDVKIDMRRASQYWNLFTQQPPVDLEGSVAAKVGWTSTADESWHATGSYKISDVQIRSEEVRNSIRVPRLGGEINMIGGPRSELIAGLLQTNLTLVGNNLDVSAELISTEASRMPWRIEAEGRIASLASMLSRWMPTNVRGADGRFRIELLGDLSPTVCSMNRATIALSQPRFAYGRHLIERQHIDVGFDGQWQWPTKRLVVKSLTLDSDVVSAHMHGLVDSTTTDLEIQWQANLERLATVGERQVSDKSHSSLQYQPARTVVVLDSAMRRSSDFHLRGTARGKMVFQGVGDTVQVTAEASASDFAVLELAKKPLASDVRSLSPVRPQGVTLDNTSVNFQAAVLAAASSGSSADALRVVWTEPQLTFGASMRYARPSRRVVVNRITLSGQWIETELDGSAVWDSDITDVTLSGMTRVNVNELAKQFSMLTTVPCELEGVHESALQFRIQRTAEGESTLAIETSLGWERGKVGCVQFGQASLPLRITDQRTNIATTTIPVGGGQVVLSGDLLYGSGPTVFRFQPGMLAESIELTEEMTDGFVEFIAPPVHRVEKIRGEFGLEILEGVIVIRNLDQSRALGKLNIAGAEMALTPMMRELKGAVEQLRTDSETRSPGPAKIPDGRIMVPKQTVDFDLDLGVANHRRFQFDLDGMTIVSSGDVALDGKLAMIVEVPLRGAGVRDQSGHAQERIASIPITGSIYYPRIDPIGIGSSVTLLVRTARHARDRLLRRQIKMDDVPLERLTGVPKQGELRQGELRQGELGRRPPTSQTR